MTAMARALKCDVCGSFIDVSEDAAQRWLTVQVFPTVKADEDEDYTENDFCSPHHAAVFFLSKATAVSPLALLRILEAMKYSTPQSIAAVAPNDQGWRDLLRSLEYESSRIIRLLESMKELDERTT